MRFNVSHDGKPTATNNRKKGARHSICNVLASSRLPQALELRAFICGNRHDFFAMDVVRNRPNVLTIVGE